MTRLRTLWIASADGLDRGGQVNLARLLPRLDRGLHRDRVILPGRGPLHQHLSEAGTECLVERIPAVPPRSWSDRLACLRPFLALHRFRPHVVCVDASAQLEVVRQLSWGSGARLLWHAQAVPVDDAEAAWIRHADHVVAVAEHVAERVRELVPELPVECVPNAVDTERFAPGAEDGLREELGAAASDPVVLFVGPLERVKGVDDLIEAFAEVVTRVSDAWLWLVGGGAEVELMERLVAERGLEARVRFVGVRRDVERFYRAADLFVLASHTEGMSLSLLEAMASSTTCIASDIPATRDLLPEDAGVRIPARDPARLAEELLALLAAPARREALGARAREHVVRNHRLAHHVERFSRALERVAGRRE